MHGLRHGLRRVIVGALERSFDAMPESLGRRLADSRRLAAQQSALRRVATLVAEAHEPIDVFEAVTREVGLLSGADLARMERYETDGTVTGVAGWAREAGGQLPVCARMTLEGPSIAALVRELGGAVRVDSFENAAGPFAREARALGIRSSVGCPIVVAGRLWGVIAASSKREEPFGAGSESEIAGFTELVATAIANAEAGAELAASRARVVAAADDARQRLERDLHDGIQQRLVALALELRGAEEVAPPSLHRELSRISAGLSGALDELREIARGIHPAILTEGGLVPALNALARRSPVPVELNVQVQHRLPQRVEVAAYYVVSEALANAAKHAGASTVDIHVVAADGTLDLSVGDDGIGGADPSRGSGLIGLADRVAAMGGSMSVTSPWGHGTSLRVSLPA
jgi:signal transduction histidine kinase